MISTAPLVRETSITIKMSVENKRCREKRWRGKRNDAFVNLNICTQKRLLNEGCSEWGLKGCSRIRNASLFFVSRPAALTIICNSPFPHLVIWRAQRSNRRCGLWKGKYRRDRDKHNSELTLKHGYLFVCRTQCLPGLNRDHCGLNYVCK